jgi:hypothetical protein
MNLYCTKVTGTDATSFETNHKAVAVLIDEIEIAETTYTHWLDYANFGNLIVSPLDWNDVRYRQISNEPRYILYLSLG